MQIRQLRCPNCCGAVDENKLVCSCCGTKFVNDKDGLKMVEVERDTSSTIEVQSSVSLHYAPKEYENERMIAAKKEIANDIANILLKENLLTFTLEHDFRRCTQVLHAKLRVFNPYHRF